MTNLRDNTRIKRKVAGLMPSFLRPFAYRVYSFLFESRPFAPRGRPKFELPPEVLYCAISYNRYGGYCVPMAAKSRPAVQRILARRVYEPDTLAFMREHCGDGDIVHAGTFFGDFLPALSSACSPQAKVWAFEPNPDNFRCASITVAVNNLGNVSLMNAGLGAAATQQCVQTKDDAGQPLGGASRIIPQSDANDGSENVDIVAIDDIVPGDRNVSIMQLDVEGYEQEALTGGLQTIRRCRPMIVLEVPPDSDLTRSEWFSRTLLSMGYRQTAEVHYNQVFECRS